MSRRGPTARSVAAHVLLRVEKDQAFASASLDSELARAVQLTPADRRLATELVYGVLRCETFLDDRIERYTRKGVEKLDVEVRVHLRVAAYQILILDRIPAFAAVSAAVDLVRDARGHQVSRFANAVLRKIATEVQDHGRVSMNDAVKSSIHPGLLRRVTQALGGREQAEAMLSTGPFPPALGIRIHAVQDVDAWSRLLEQSGSNVRVQRGKVSPRCLCLFGAGRPDDLPGFDTAWSVQEEGSQVLGAAVGARQGERVLDSCAGRGNKTLLLAENVGPSGWVDAADLYEPKLDALVTRARALNLPVRNTYAVDWTLGTGDVPDGYDRVLVDAPCSGIGTMRRRPEVAHRNLDRTLPALQELQKGILRHAITRCRPGGTVVYAVCSILEDEAEAIVQAVSSEGTMEPAPFDDSAIELIRGKTALRLLPHIHGTDGYFLASFRKR